MRVQGGGLRGWSLGFREQGSGFRVRTARVPFWPRMTVAEATVAVTDVASTCESVNNKMRQ